MPTATALERKFLEAIRDSDFHDGRDPVGDEVWTDVTLDDFGDEKQGRALMVTCKQKGFCDFTRGKDGGIWITQAGMNAIGADA